MKSAFAPALRAVRHSLPPLLLIQAAAVALVVLYYANPAFRAGADRVEEVKAQGGLLFSSLSTSVAGAILPQIARFATRRPLVPASQFGFQFLFFGFLGITVDLLYRSLAVLLGSTPSVQIVTEKVLIDQFLYSPCVSIPLSSIAFLWQENGFRFRATGAAVKDGRFSQRYASLLVTCWCFWLPVLACVYALPTELQFLLFLCANGAWSLLLTFISSEPN